MKTFLRWMGIGFLAYLWMGGIAAQNPISPTVGGKKKVSQSPADTNNPLREKFERVVQELNSPHFQKREEAQEALMQMGEKILPYVEMSLEHSPQTSSLPPETERRLRTIQERLLPQSIFQDVVDKVCRADSFQKMEAELESYLNHLWDKFHQATPRVLWNPQKGVLVALDGENKENRPGSNSVTFRPCTGTTNYSQYGKIDMCAEELQNTLKFLVRIPQQTIVTNPQCSVQDASARPYFPEANPVGLQDLTSPYLYLVRQNQAVQKSEGTSCPSITSPLLFYTQLEDPLEEFKARWRFVKTLIQKKSSSESAWKMFQVDFIAEEPAPGGRSYYGSPIVYYNRRDYHPEVKERSTAGLDLSGKWQNFLKHVDSLMQKTTSMDELPGEVEKVLAASFSSLKPKGKEGSIVYLLNPDLGILVVVAGDFERSVEGILQSLAEKGGNPQASKSSDEEKLLSSLSFRNINLGFTYGFCYRPKESKSPGKEGSDASDGEQMILNGGITPQGTPITYFARRVPFQKNACVDSVIYTSHVIPEQRGRPYYYETNQIELPVLDQPLRLAFYLAGEARLTLTRKTEKILDKMSLQEKNSVGLGKGIQFGFPNGQGSTYMAKDIALIQLVTRHPARVAVIDAQGEKNHPSPDGKNPTPTVDEQPYFYLPDFYPGQLPVFDQYRLQRIKEWIQTLWPDKKCP